MKQRVTLTLDADVYLAAKTKVENISLVVNDLLSKFLSCNGIDAEEEELERELDDLNKERENLAKSIATKSAELAAVRQQNQRIAKEQKENVEMMYDSIRANSPMDR